VSIICKDYTILIKGLTTFADFGVHGGSWKSISEATEEQLKFSLFSGGFAIPRRVGK
jgi:hypothetical protein